MKKVYFAPETTQTNVIVESLLQNLSNQGGGNWSQGGVGDDDPDDGVPDDGRAKPSVWE